MENSDPGHVPKWDPVDFDSATVRPAPYPDMHVLTVSGNAPSGGQSTLGAKLERAMYVVQPEYWQIWVYYDSQDAIFQTLAPYNVSLPIGGSKGTKGIEVIGATKSVKIDIL
jgi:hypothetical protein